VKFLGVIAAAIAAGLTIVLLAHVSVRRSRAGRHAAGSGRAAGFHHEGAGVGFMSRQPVAYLLFGVGAMITLVMEMLGKPAMVFALGMYLPLELNTPALVGGFLSHFLNKRGKDRRRAGRGFASAA
jgi:uncharacterized oligopeptide transporter (OPT) family protein